MARPRPTATIRGTARSPSATTRLLALPRNFAISQEIWRPITKWKPEPLKPQGYILGKYHVLDEEYRNDATVAFPITREQAVAEYTETLRRTLTEAPDGAMLLYIQDLELMDFGEEALEILGEAWSTVRAEGIADMRFITPDDYIDELRARSEPLPHLRFHQASWAPEIRLVLRSDGHYPPRDAGAFRGVDNDREVFRRWPFIFWEPGRFIADTFRALIEPFGYGTQHPARRRRARGRGHGPHAARRRAPASPSTCAPCSAPATPAGSPTKPATNGSYLHGLAITEILRSNLHEDAAAEWSAGAPPASTPTQPQRSHPKPQPRSPEDGGRCRSARSRGSTACWRSSSTRASHRCATRIEQLGDRAGSRAQRADAEQHLANAERRRRRASALIRQVHAENTKFITNCSIDPRAIQRMLALMQEHCKESYLALNEIQRAWMQIEDTAALLEATYAYLYDVYPPRFPAILRDLLSEEELVAIEDPALA